MDSIKVGSSTGAATVLVIGPIMQTADPSLPHEGIDLSIAPWNAGGDDFTLDFSTAGSSALVEEAATAGELASWTNLGGGLYQITVDSGRVISGRAERTCYAKVRGTDFYHAVKKFKIVRHNEMSQPECNSSGEQTSTVSPKAGSIVETSFGDDALSARVLDEDAITNAHIANDAFGAEHFAPAWLEAAGFAADTKFYAFDIDVERDGSTTDEYTVTPTYNGVEVPFASLSGAPTLTIVKRADGATLINAQALTRVGTTNSWKYNETNALKLLAASETYLAYVSFNDGSVRTPKVKLIKIRVAS